MSDATPPSSAAAAPFTLIAPRRNIAGDFEWSVHSLPPLVRRHCAQLFPDRAPPDDRTLVIVTVQRTQHDIIQMGAEVDREKDVCLERFYAWGNDVMARLRADAAVAQASPPWADLIDPCSGYPAYGRHGSTLYSEVEGMQTLLQYKQGKVGGCSVIVHPQWQSNMYPASMFTDAPLEVVERACAAARFDARMRWDFAAATAVDTDSDAPLASNA